MRWLALLALLFVLAGCGGGAGLLVAAFDDDSSSGSSQAAEIEDLEVLARKSPATIQFLLKDRQSVPQDVEVFSTLLRVEPRTWVSPDHFPVGR